MKKSKLLLLGILALVSAGAYADDEPVLSDYYSSIGDVSDGQTEAYLYNIESDAYFSEGQPWGTRATVSDAPNKVFKVALNADGKTYTLNDFSAKKNAWLAVFTDGANSIWVDNLSGTNVNNWGINQVGTSKTYTITNAWEGVLAKNPDNDQLWFSNVTSTWAFITPANYEAFRSAHYAWECSQINVGDDITSMAPATWVNGGNAYDGGTERFNNPSFVAGKVIYQKIEGLPAGKYEVKTYGATSLADWQGQTGYGTGIAQIYANTTVKDVEVLYQKSCTLSDYEHTLNAVVGEDGVLEYGIQNVATGGCWYVVKLISIKVLSLGVDLSDFEESFNTAVGNAKAVDQNEPMNADVLTDLKNAISTYEGKFSTFKSEGQINEAKKALNDAADAANGSIAAYAAIRNALATLDAAGQASFKASEVGQKYVNNKYADEDYSEALKTAINSQTSENADMTLLIADAAVASGAGWENFRSGMNQQYDGAPDNLYMDEWSGGAHTRDICQTISLKAGEYTLKAATRAAAGVETKVYANVNGTEYATAGHADGNADGELGNGWSWTVVEFSVASDADVTIGFYSEVNNSWAGADDFRLIRKGDYVAPEIAAETVTLNQSSITLNTASNSATLEATVGPEGANQNVSWSSSDENVAKVVNGVVTGVAPGTATITATSAENEEVKATATVTASYNETANLPTSKTVEHEDGSKTVYTFSAVNLIKNGSFEYGNPFYGWTNGAGGTLASDMFTAADGIITSKANQGAGGAGSISTKWEVEANATYVFGYKTKANTAGNCKYQKVSLTNTTDEDVVVSNDNQSVGTEWTDVQYVFTNDGYAGLQFRARWLGGIVSFDDFYLLKVTNIEEIPAPAPEIADLTITDGVAIEVPEDATYNVTYKRTFNAANKWQSLVLPFDFIVTADMLEDVVMAQITSATINGEELTINIEKLAADDKVNDICKPLFIAAKKTGTFDIPFGEVAVPSDNNMLEDCGYLYGDNYELTVFPVLTGKRSGIAGSWVMSGGKLCTVADNSNKLGINRWYMKFDDSEPCAKIRIVVNGLDDLDVETTAIAEAFAEAAGIKSYTISGANAKADAKGIVIINGKKTFVK